jgi:WD40 repeat protein
MLREFKGHASPVTTVALFPDGRRGLSGSLDHTVRIWDLKTGSELIRLEGHTDAVEAVAIIPDGKRALSVSHTQLV